MTAGQTSSFSSGSPRERQIGVSHAIAYASSAARARVGDTPPKHLNTRQVALGVVWLTMALSAIVFSEPAPVDALLFGLLIFLPIVGLVRFSPLLALPLCGWLLIAALGFLASLTATDAALSARHTAITLYLSLIVIVLAGFVMSDPARHGRLIGSGLFAAAVIGACLGIIGYFDVVPGSYDLFTLYGRARGGFKDPNVLGAFLSATIVIALHFSLHARGAVRAWYVTGFVIIILALLLTFSRSAWLTSFAAIAMYLYLSILVAPSNKRRMTLLAMTGGGGLLCVVLLLGALQFSSVSELLAERATLSQSHDVGPEGRFGGMTKAMQVIIQSPLGIGSLEFRPRFHHEEPHNVWLAMFLNTGWAGGLIYFLLTIGTAIYGFRRLTKPSPMQDLFVVFFAGYVATLIGGLVVDSDHWRHFFILSGVVTGFSLAPTGPLTIPERRMAFLQRAPANSQGES
ncbi:MAG: O-antigen ligase family protein [Pseudomonadota bacterium]